MKKALKLQTNGNKLCKVVSAHSITNLMIEDYAPRFIQLYDEDKCLINTDNFDDDKIFTAEEADEFGWTINPCVWRPPCFFVDKKTGKTVPRRASFTQGAADGAGSIKELLNNRVPTSLRKNVKTFFGLVEADMNISAASDSLVGGIDALIGLTEELYYELQPVMLDYWKTCKGGNRSLTDDQAVKLHEALDRNVLRHTQIQRSLT